jgi:AcrR family transcriptional regulator
MQPVTRPYKGVSADERRTRRRARLIEAGLDVLGEEGMANTTMTAVCARAGLTERYFYESFEGREELLAAVFDAVSQEVTSAVLGAVAEAPEDLLERCRAAAGALIDALTDDPRKARAYVEAIGSEALKRRRAATMRLYAGFLAEQIRVVYDLRDERHEKSVALAATILVGGMSEAVMQWLDGTLELSRDELVDECARLCVAAADGIRAGAA